MNTALGQASYPALLSLCNVPMELRNTQWIDFQQRYEQGPIHCKEDVWRVTPSRFRRVILSV